MGIYFEIYGDVKKFLKKVEVKEIEFGMEKVKEVLKYIFLFEILEELRIGEFILKDIIEVFVRLERDFCDELLKFLFC